MPGIFSLRRQNLFSVLAFVLLTACLTLPVSAASSVSSQGLAPIAAVANSAALSNISVKVQVPTSMRSAPFDTDRYLNIPPGFTVSVYARLGGARFMTLTPDGNLLVSQPGNGKVSLVRPNGGGDPLISDFVTGLSKPHDLVFHTIGSTTYLYLSETSQIDRFIYHNGDLTAQNRQVVVSGLPDASLPELHGAYGHELKNIALDSNDKLYVSIGSTCNACTEDTLSTPLRAAIYQYNADGSNGRVFARGLRNAEGLALIPGTNTLWVAVNNRDNIACPSVNVGEGCSSVGQVNPAYVDNHPPEEFTQVVDGGNYGWPFCNPNPDTTTAHLYNYDNMPFDRDNQFNADGSKLDCTKANRINKGIQAHSAPLGLTFLQNTNFSPFYRAGAVVALHGSWNRQQKTGAKLAYFPWNSQTQTPGPQSDLVSGWLDDASQSYWGRPVDTAVDPQGSLFISDDASGTIYKLALLPSIVVKSTQDDGNSAADTLSYALTHHQYGQPITFQLNGGGNTINVTGPLVVPAGSLIEGGCSNGPDIWLKWSGSGAGGPGLVITGPAWLHGLRVSGFKGQPIVTHAGPVQLSCVVAHK